MLNLGLDFNKNEYNSYTAITSCPPTKKKRFPDKNEDKITTKSMRENGNMCKNHFFSKTFSNTQSQGFIKTNDNCNG